MARLAAGGLRVTLDARQEKIGYKIREAQLQKVPFMMLAGASGVEAGAVSFRYRDGHQDNGLSVDEAIARVRAGEAFACSVRTKVNPSGVKNTDLSLPWMA